MNTAIADRVEAIDSTIALADEFNMIAGEAARFVKKHPSAPVRWATRGVLLRDGTRIYLEALKTPGGWRFSRAAIMAFLARLTADARGARASTNIDHAEHAAADASCAAAGL